MSRERGGGQKTCASSSDCRDTDSSERRPTDMSAHEQSQPVPAEESQHAHQQLIGEREAEADRKHRDWCTGEDQVPMNDCRERTEERRAGLSAAAAT